ncbi:hypothetical protein AK812_SmicGene4284 [Symbiodinium microadriaticum]|uniref:RNase H type-1 domain-containing protein n=1 Tax=Symbiodinium microadriaticum TaxID=2951 RepID=A0A1Q9EWU1_SYMMI|nr:hypothetical protein AK812_SmicGene4284 [Symbiodinium microadriaticum]
MPRLSALPAPMDLSCRLSEAFVRLHCLDVKVITIYGVPRCLPEAAAKNDLLLAWAYQRATLSCVPAIVAGDFNTCPTELPSWQAFQGLGWVELGEYASVVHDLHLPCTCKGATRYDTFLLPPSLFQFFSSADVLEDCHLFDSHAPMRLHLRMPGLAPSKWLWPLPRTFEGLMLNAANLAPAYNEVGVPLRPAFAPEVPEVSQGDKLRLWSTAVEDAVSRAIKLEHASQTQQNLRGLPRSCRGRCRPVERKKACPPRLPRAGRHGDPEPVAEDTSVLGRQRLRQLRRLTTFAQGLSKHLRGAFRGPLSPDGWPISLDKEWGAICRAPGYGASFQCWVLQWPCFEYYPLHRPELAFVNDLTSLVKFDVDALQRQAVAVKCKLFKYQLQVDATDFGGSRSFVRIRPPEKPPFTCVLLDHTAPARLLSRHTFQLCTFQVRDSKPFELLSQVSFAQVQGQVTDSQAETVTVLFPADDDIVLPSSGELRRLRHDSSWEGVVGSLMAYWSPIWNRESAQAASDLEDWPSYCHLVRLLTSPCSHISVNMLDEAAWLHVAHSLSPRKATGICGWHNKDLRLLPRDALVDLASILDQLLSAGFPDFLMKARVAVLSKVTTPDSAAQARPITILSCLFRLWARVLCSQVLQAWSLQLPRSITGCIKGRSALDLSYEVQALVEDSLCQQTDLSGFCLDLRKAFNFLPRAPLEDLLKRLGLPAYVATGWRLSLARVTRSFQIHGSLGPELPSSTAAPEGDPTSVLGMIAVCWFFVELLQGVVSPKAYVDNLSWSSDDPENHAPALLILEDFRQALSLEIDWHKTYQWATSSLSRNWWLTIGVDFLPGAVCMVESVKELGSYFQFTRRLSRGPFLQRVQEALQRLSKLGSDPQGLPTKAQVVQGGVWPFLFFGTEGIAPSCTTMHSLRSAAARAIIGNYHTLSPFAALGFLQGAQDPEIFLLCHHVSQLRRALVTSPSVASQVLRRLAGPTIKHRAVCGPAGALQVLLHRNDWTVQADGSFRGPLHCQFNLLSTSARQARNMFQLAWGSRVQDEIQHRNGLCNAPTPHTELSAATLHCFQPWEQKFLARSMCGGFMSGAERNTWSRDSTDLCPLCQELDTRSHRIFHCPALQDKRLPHQEVLNEVQRLLPHWTQMPFVSWPFEASVLQLFLAKLCLPALAAPPSDQQVLLFTDASAVHTTCTTARVTAWAVVQGHPPERAPDLLPSDLERTSLLSRFSVLGQGCTPGPQTVPRAELAALAWASNWASQRPSCSIIAYSDCQSALDLWHKWHRFGWNAIRNCANADLLNNIPRPSGMQVKKIKAHRSSAELHRCTNWDQWLAAGNQAADTAAKQACCDLPDALKAMADEVALHCKREQRLLKRFFRAILDMGVLDASKRRQEARQLHETQVLQVATASTLSELWGRFRTWQVPPTGLLSIPDAWEENWETWPFGLQYGRSMLSWLQHLRWHEPPATPANSWEVSYLEMMLSFSETAAVPPLVENVFSPGSYWPLVQARSQLQHVSLRQLVTCFRAALLQLGKLLGHAIFPCAEIKDVAYLRFFSIPAPCAGLAARPSLPGSGWIDLLEKLGSSDCAVELLAGTSWS